MANRWFEVLRRLYSWAAGGKNITITPQDYAERFGQFGLKKPFRGKRQRRRKGWHKKWEIGRIYKALEQESQRTCLMFELYFLTGCRRDARCRDFPPLEGRDQYNPQSDIVRIRRRSGVTDFRLHDCRRTLASLLPRLQEAVGFSKK